MPHPIPVDEREAYLEEQLAFISRQQASNVPVFLTGLEIRIPDPRDWLMQDDPEIARSAAVGFAESGDLMSDIKGPAMNQAASPSCVVHTGSQGQSVFQQQEEGIWRVFDALRAHRETGAENQGRYPDDILAYAKSTGFPIAGGEARYKISAYAFTTDTDGPEWENTIKASLAARKPVWICYLIPSQFGWESGGPMTQGYHESLIVGWRPDAFLILNSWGTGWGRNGFGWLPIAYLKQQGRQNGLCRAHTVVDERSDFNPPPPPPPPVKKKYFITGDTVSPEAATLQAGMAYPLAGGVILDLRTIRVEGDDNPPPPPDTLTVTGYDRQIVESGGSFMVIGSGFTEGVLTVSWGGQVLSAFRSSPTRVDVTAPRVETTTANEVTVRLEGATAIGPPLTVTGGGDPTPGVLQVALNVAPLGLRAQLAATATKDGQPVATQMHLAVNGVDAGLMNVKNVGAGRRGVWIVTNQSGTHLTVTAENRLTGETGSQSTTL